MKKINANTIGTITCVDDNTHHCFSIDRPCNQDGGELIITSLAEINNLV